MEGQRRGEGPPTYLSILRLLKLDLLEGQGGTLRLEDCSLILGRKFRHCEMCGGFWLP